jgi:hypothetical protein
MVLRLVGGGGPRPPAYQAPAYTTPPEMSVAATRDAPSVILPSQPAPSADYGYSSGGGGGGGGGSVAAAAPVAPPAPPRPNLQDYIHGNFQYGAANDEANRRLQEFDADTTRQQGLVQADQSTRRHQLQQTLDDQGEQNAEGMAARGILRSGLTFQNQDKINQFGDQQRGTIESLLNNFVTQRQGGRAQQEAANRASIADAISKITDQYNQQFGV